MESTRAALADEGFGIITDDRHGGNAQGKAATSSIPPQVILGACRPQLAHRPIEADPSIATLLPCNVVVRQTDTNTCIVEAFDPDDMTRISDNEALKSVAD